MKQDNPSTPSPGNAPQEEKPEITYPTHWDYTLFGTSKVRVARAVGEVLGQREHNFYESNKSKSGKYCSFKISLVVNDERDRLELGAKFGAHDHILFVL